MAQVLQLPRRVVDATLGRLTVPVRSLDDWGRDPHLVAAIAPLARARWRVSLGGSQHLPARAGALLVVNNRRLSFSTLYASLAIGDAVDRPVRFVGRPDVAPVGALLGRIGGLLDHPDEVFGALRRGELVVASCTPTRHARHAGDVDHALLGAAVRAGVAVHPVATLNSTWSTACRVEIGAAVRPRRNRRGPLIEVELADAVRNHLQRLLDGMA